MHSPANANGSGDGLAFSVCLGQCRWEDYDGTDAADQILFRLPGTLTNLWMRMSANSRNGTSTMRTRVNAANANQSVSIPASTTGDYTDASSTDTVAAGDKLTYQRTESGGSAGVITWNHISVAFTATTNTAVVFFCGGNYTEGLTSVTRYLGLSGITSGTATEANTQAKMKVTATFKNLFYHAIVNAATQAYTWKLRKGGVDGNLSVSITASTTGFFEDITHTDTVVADDLVNYSLTAGSAVNNLLGFGGVDMETTDSTTEMIATENGASVAMNAATTYNLACLSLVDQYGTEAASGGQANFVGTASKLRCKVATNGVSAGSTLRLRKGAANVNQAVSITASTTGWYEDASGTDAIVLTDIINYQLVTGATGTNLKMSAQAMTLALTSSAVSTKFFVMF